MNRNGATLLAAASVVVVLGVTGAAVVAGGGGGGSPSVAPADVPATLAADNPLPSYVASAPAQPAVTPGSYPGLVAPPAYQAVPNGTISLRPAPAGPGAVDTGVGPAYDPGYRDSIEGHVLRECPRPSNATAEPFRTCYDQKKNENQPTPNPPLP
ncbi:MAG: hypothetical protein M3Z02_03375 [Actinomycetota bacterium]|nr:hypothetical protein [Actinomycetota bacterium]